MSGKRLTTEARAARQKTMMSLRSWMTRNDVSRRDVAGMMGITTGHLSTLINANRTPSEEQVDAAKRLMGGEPVSSTSAVAKRPRSSATPATKVAHESVSSITTPKISARPNIRPLTESEGNFVATIAKVWLKDHKGASKDEFVEMVRVLSIAIRS
jgi:hypothetical protein